MGSASETVELDVVLIGAGFGSFTLLPRLRNLGYQVKVFERGDGPGGVWHWNRYPGARVDTDSPAYQLFDKELWDEFTFTERYPGWRDLQRYFAFVEKKWDLRRDIAYNKNVEAASWDEVSQRWTVNCSDGTEAKCKWLIFSVGFASKQYMPHINGAQEFQGSIYHTARWPVQGVDLKNKRIAVIGTGASGIQTIQESGPVCKHLTVYQRTPNLSIPMQQRRLDPVEERKKKDTGVYDEAFRLCETTFGGIPYESYDKNTFDDTPEQREAFYESLFDEGGFKFWVGNYKDMTTDTKANDAAYDFWRRSVLKRVKNPMKAELVAPKIPPHPYGAKRPSLEQNYFEVLDQDNVEIVDVNRFPIDAINETGIRTSQGQADFDVIIFATGFDALTGGFMDIHIQGKDGLRLNEYWNDGVRTSFGMSAPNFPNMFYLFGPQAPTTFTNGPTCIQIQGKWLVNLIKELDDKGVQSIEAQTAAALEWSEKVQEAWDATLLSKGKISGSSSWWSGANIPGKKIQPLSWAGGMPAYRKMLDQSLENEYQGWNLC